MNKRRAGFLLWLLPLALIASACASATPEPTQTDLNALYTQAAMTIAVQFTQTAQQAQPSETIPALPSPTGIASPLPTEVPATSSPTPFPETPTPQPPTETPAPLEPSPTPIPCDLALFERDVSVPDESIFTPGSRFTKIWRLRNIGSCTWTQDYALVFISGNAMSDEVVIDIPEEVPPQATIDLVLNLTAPGLSGNYTGSWMLRNPEHMLFGIGESGMEPLSVLITVTAPNPDYVYDFAANFCTAQWSSGDGPLNCPGDVGDPQGFVVYLDNPRLESNAENEPALWTQPNQADDGWISGIFPSVRIQKDDHFTAWIGCLEGSQGCDVIFRLDYRTAGGNLTNLAAWHEVYDGSITYIDLDLSDLKGKSVEFILGVQVNNDIPEQSEGFWLVPAIREDRST